MQERIGLLTLLIHELVMIPHKDFYRGRTALALNLEAVYLDSLAQKSH